MSNTLKCQVCGKPATVHLTQIVNSKIHKVDLCEACAQAKGVTDPSGFSLGDLLMKGTGVVESVTEQFVCEQCGFTQANFRKTGRFGCPACWERFRELVSPLLTNLHRGTTHSGKVPSRLLARLGVHERLEKLRVELKAAIAAERYEEAARFRDEITQLSAGTMARGASGDED